MKNEFESTLENDRRPRVDLVFGKPGHEIEYVLTTRKNKFAEADSISYDWEDEIIQRLGEGWSVMNRGERIEIVPPNGERSAESDSKLREVIQSVIGAEYYFPEII